MNLPPRSRAVMMTGCVSGHDGIAELDCLGQYYASVRGPRVTLADVRARFASQSEAQRVHWNSVAVLYAACVALGLLEAPK